MPAKTLRDDLSDVRDDLSGIRPGSHRLRMGAKNRVTVIEIVRAVMERRGLSQKAMAINADIPESVLSDGLSGKRNLAADWLFNQEDAFLLALIDEVITRRRLTPESKRKVTAGRIGELVRLLLEEGVA